jgi:hypothetical protein
VTISGLSAPALRESLDVWFASNPWPGDRRHAVFGTMFFFFKAPPKLGFQWSLHYYQFKHRFVKVRLKEMGCKLLIIIIIFDHRRVRAAAE